MAALSFSQANSNFGTPSAGSVSIAYTSNTTAGSYFLAIFGAPAGEVLGSVTDSLGNIWTQVGTSFTTGPTATIYTVSLYQCAKNVSSSANTVHFNTTGSAGVSLFGIAEFTGQAVSSPLDQVVQSNWTTTSGGNNTISVGPVVASTTNEEIIVLCLAHAGDVPVSAGTGYTLIVGWTGSNGPLGSYGPQTAAGSYSTTILAANGNNEGAAFLISVKSSSSAPIGGGGNSSWLTIDLNNGLRGLRH